MDDRRYFAPEVIQTSEMDCGPATLKCLLEGFSISASYGRLREACQTDVDGTSIDTMEEMARQLGLVAEQTMLPEDHLLLSEADVLPAIVVTNTPGGFTHFVVVWRLHGPFIQVMDPGTGRRWLAKESFLRTLYRHVMPVPAVAWREWAGTNGFCGPLLQRLENLGIAQPDAQGLIDKALQDPGWYAIAALDATTRMMTALVEAGGIQSGSEASRILGRYFQQALDAESADRDVIPTVYWTIRPMLEPNEPVLEFNEPVLEPNKEELVLLRGAVLVRVSGRAEAVATVANDATVADGGTGMPLSPELVAVLQEEKSRPMQEVWRYLRRDGTLLYLGLVVGLAVIAVAGIIEIVQLRGLLDLGNQLDLGQRNSVLLLLFAFAVGLLALQMPLDATTLRTGRRLEARMRTAFLRKIPRLNDRYFQSRLISDMTQRAHDLRSLSSLPNLGTTFLLTGFEIVLTVVAIVVLDPKSLLIALLAVISSVALSLASNTYLVELDLRLRTHIGALSRFYLDALLGLIPIRAHGAERTVRREHEALLVEWVRTGYQSMWAGAAVSGLESLVSTLFSIWLLLNFVSQGGAPSGVLLIFFWALNLPRLGQSLAGLIQRYRLQHNLVLRFLEPLGAVEDNEAAEDNGSENNEVAPHEQDVKATTEADDSALDDSVLKGIGLDFEDVTVQASGKTILTDINLSVAPGTHLAIVGPSGAGKSSLVGILLGWHRPSSGRLRIDGASLTPQGLQRMRQETAWVDPSVQLWNRSLLDNLRYGFADNGGSGLEGILDQADLYDVLARMPSGLQTGLGEGGAFLSGGEGQRVRLGRAMLRTDARLVILDEPFRGLDRAKRRALLAQSRQLWPQATFICITHDVTQTLEFERVLVIEGGRITEDGAPEDLLADPETRYLELMQADSAIRQEMWSGEQWRHIQMVEGRLTEAGTSQESGTNQVERG
jgi:ABC-type bacteriocin/lantibiotic exporter with double-glycine peptidase domain